MTGKEFLNIFQLGNEITIKFTKYIEELEEQFEVNMLATVVSVEIEDEDILVITVDESKYSKINEKLEKPIWTNLNYQKTFSQLYMRKNIFKIYDSYEDSIKCFDIVNNDLINQYLLSNENISYTNWLENKVLNL